jgi:hypothetical protein
MFCAGGYLLAQTRCGVILPHGLCSKWRKLLFYKMESPWARHRQKGIYLSISIYKDT